MVKTCKKHIPAIALTLLVLFPAIVCAEEKTHFRIVLDPGHGGAPLEPVSRHGDKYDFTSGEYLQAYNIGTFFGKYRESELVYGLCVEIKGVLDRWQGRSLAEIGKENTIWFSKPESRVDLETLIIRPPGLGPEEIRGFADPNAAYRLYDYPSGGVRKPGRISAINGLGPEMVVSLHLRNKFFANDSGGLAIIAPPARFLREMVNIIWDVRDKPVMDKNRFAAVLPREYLPYLDWFVFEKGRSETDCLVEDLFVYLTGYPNLKGTFKPDLTEYRGLRENMVTWPYQRLEKSRSIFSVNRDSPFIKREFCPFEEKRRHAGPQGYGGDNHYAAMELLRFLRWQVDAKELKLIYRIGTPLVSTWSLPLYINAINAFLELGCIDSDTDTLLLTVYRRETAVSLSLGILSLLYGTEPGQGNSLPAGRRIEWEEYENYFAVPENPGRKEILMVEYFLKGGILMYPLLACSLLSLTVIVNRAIVYYLNRRRPWGNALGTESGEKEFFGSSLAPREKIKGSVRLVLSCVFVNRGLSEKDLESKVSLVGRLELRRLTRYLHALELAGRIAPLLGLFGTVLGLTGTFQSVSVLKQAVNPSVLASGIWEALITTVAGLFVGIPSLIFHHFYENLVRDTAFEMKVYAEKGVSNQAKKAGP